MSKAKTIIITAAVTAAVTSAIWLAGIVSFLAFFGDTAPFSVTVGAPESVKLGDEFPLVVTTRNVGDEPSTLGSIDLYDSFAAGFEVVKVAPFPREVSNLFDLRSYFFTEQLAPGAEVVVTFTLRAVKSGTWAGQVDSCTPAEDYASVNVVIHVEE